jgi:hypothetical protein
MAEEDSLSFQRNPHTSLCGSSQRLPNNRDCLI